MFRIIATCVFHGQEPLQDPLRRGPDTFRQQRRPGIIYMHTNRESFLSAGFTPRQGFSGAWRTRMANEPGEFLDLIGPFTKRRGKYFLRHRGALKTMPRGFQQHADSPIADGQKWKHFLVGRKITDKQGKAES